MLACIIPARSGSKRIKNKNIKSFMGKPIIAYSIEAAKAANIFDRIIISSDSEEIRDVSLQYGAEAPFLRPAELSDDFCGLKQVFDHAVSEIESDNITLSFACCLFATAPLVDPADMVRGLNLLKDDTASRRSLAVTMYPSPIQRAMQLDANDSLVMIQPEHKLTRSQDLPSTFYDAGQFFWERIDTSRSQALRNEPLPVFINSVRVRDIDTEADWQMAERQYQLLKYIPKSS